MAELDVVREINVDTARSLKLRLRFDELDAVIDLSDPAVFAARRELGKVVGCIIENSTVSAKTFPPYGENGALHEPPARRATGIVEFLRLYGLWPRRRRTFVAQRPSVEEGQ